MSNSAKPPDPVQQPSSKPPDAAQQSSSSNPVFKKKPSHKDFIFGKSIGEGSYSSVYLAREVESEQEFAIKVLQKAHITRERKAEYVRRERDVFMMIQNRPFFVHLYCTFQDDERLYFVLSYAQRGELLDYIKKVGCFDEKCTRFYVAEIILALEHLKKLGIIHRDLKPENILLDKKMHIKITDFGSAKILGNIAMGPETPPAINGEGKPNFKRKNSFVGTAQYVSPEVLKSKLTHHASDVWALGCIIFQLLSGALPFHGGHEYQIFQKILALQYDFPEGFDASARDLVGKLLVLDPDQRLGSDDTGGFETLKSHPFFEEFDWTDLHEQQPPDILPYLPPVGECKEPLWGRPPGYNVGVDLPSFGEEADTAPETEFKLIQTEEQQAVRKKKLEEQAKDNKFHQFVDGNLIVKQGLLHKRKGLFARCRMFLMTEGPHLYYVDASNMVLKGEVPWSKELRPEPKNFKIFFIHTPNRTYYLEDPKGNALIWCKDIEKHYASYYGEEKKNKKDS